MQHLWKTFSKVRIMETVVLLSDVHHVRPGVLKTHLLVHEDMKGAFIQQGLWIP